MASEEVLTNVLEMLIERLTALEAQICRHTLESELSYTTAKWLRFFRSLGWSAEADPVKDIRVVHNRKTDSDEQDGDSAIRLELPALKVTTSPYSKKALTVYVLQSGGSDVSYDVMKHLVTLAEIAGAVRPFVVVYPELTVPYARAHKSPSVVQEQPAYPRMGIIAYQNARPTSGGGGGFVMSNEESSWDLVKPRGAFDSLAWVGLFVDDDEWIHNDVHEMDKNLPLGYFVDDAATKWRENAVKMWWGA
jgi:hypothetical protein